MPKHQNALFGFGGDSFMAALVGSGRCCLALGLGPPLHGQVVCFVLYVLGGGSAQHRPAAMAVASCWGWEPSCQGKQHALLRTFWEEGAEPQCVQYS